MSHVRLKNLLCEDAILKECLGKSYSLYTKSELRELSDLTNELRPIFEDFAKELSSDDLLSELYRNNPNEFNDLLNEAIGDTIKGAAGKVKGAVKGAAEKTKEKTLDALKPKIEKAAAALGKKLEGVYKKVGMEAVDEKIYKAKILPKLKGAIDSIDSKVPGAKDKLQTLQKIALKHRGKATFITGALVAIASASLALGPIAPIAIGIGMRGIYGMVAGEPPAKAFGKAAITSLIGKFVGGGATELFGSIFDGISLDASDLAEPGAVADAGAEAVASGDFQAALADFMQNVTSEEWQSGEFSPETEARIDQIVQDFEVNAEELEAQAEQFSTQMDAITDQIDAILESPDVAEAIAHTEAEGMTDDEANEYFKTLPEETQQKMEKAIELSVEALDLMERDLVPMLENMVKDIFSIISETNEAFSEGMKK